MPHISEVIQYLSADEPGSTRRGKTRNATYSSVWNVQSDKELAHKMGESIIESLMEYSLWELLGETRLSGKEFNERYVEGSLSKGISSNFGLLETVEKTE